jgi:hypothetical protein
MIMSLLAGIMSLLAGPKVAVRKVKLGATYCSPY